jgi:hypothetical protein
LEKFIFITYYYQYDLGELKHYKNIPIDLEKEEKYKFNIYNVLRYFLFENSAFNSSYIQRLKSIPGDFNKEDEINVLESILSVFNLKIDDLLTEDDKKIFKKENLNQDEIKEFYNIIIRIFTEDLVKKIDENILYIKDFFIE